MAWKKTEIYLTNGKKHFCNLCKCDLILQEKEFEMIQVKKVCSIKVREKILFCTSCKHFFITQNMSRELISKYPGYYVDVSLYDLKQNTRKKVDMKSSVNTKKQYKQLPNQCERKESTFITKNKISIDAPIYLIGKKEYCNCICLCCNSVLIEDYINIPIMFNDEFYCYYSYKSKHCCSCRRAYISKEDAISILRNINIEYRQGLKLKLENVNILRGKHALDYIFESIPSDVYYYEAYHSTSNLEDKTMELNLKSFLGEMGYTVNMLTSERRNILKSATIKYGKERIIKHLEFLIRTRVAQENGENKYAAAIRTWHDDINYVTELNI